MSTFKQNDGLKSFLESHAELRQAAMHAGLKDSPICQKWPMAGDKFFFTSEKMEDITCKNCRNKLLRMMELIAVQPDATDDNKAALKRLQKLWETELVI